MQSLDVIGIESGTDKSRLRNDYLRHYQRMMEPYRELPITLIEIGIHNGASLAMWERFFPNAKIVGLDIEPTVRRFQRDRVTIEIGSQIDRDFLRRMTSMYSPQFIIDDGSHVDEHQIVTFESLFTCLLPDGLYIVEDISPSDAPQSAATFFSSLQRELLRGRGHASVSSIEVIRGAVAIRKSANDSLDGDFDALEKLVSRSNLPESSFYLAEYMRRYGGDLERALRVVQRAAAGDPYNGWIALEMSKILEQLGRREDATNVAERARELKILESGAAPGIFSEQIAKLRGHP